MKVLLHCITLPVEDLDRSKQFYETVMGIAGDSSDDLVMFEPGEQFTLVLCTHKEFESYTRITGMKVAPKGSAEAIYSCFIDSKEMVDTILQRALSAGGSSAGPAADYSWGYAAYFRDPDGHQWEYVFNEKMLQQ